MAYRNYFDLNFCIEDALNDRPGNDSSSLRADRANVTE